MVWTEQTDLSPQLVTSAVASHPRARLAELCWPYFPSGQPCWFSITSTIAHTWASWPKILWLYSCCLVGSHFYIQANQHALNVSINFSQHGKRHSYFISKHFKVLINKILFLKFKTARARLAEYKYIILIILIIVWLQSDINKNN